MMIELGSISGYLRGIKPVDATLKPYPQLHLVTLDNFVAAMTDVPLECADAVLRVEYQLIAANARSGNDGYLNRLPGVFDGAERASSLLGSYLADDGSEHQ
jgi:hypothetical protein